MSGRRASVRALILGIVALLAEILVIFLPLHFIASGEFGILVALPSRFGLRIMIGSIIGGFTLPLMTMAGILLHWRRRPAVASGTFLASGIFAFLDGIAAPFYALPRLQPMLLLVFGIVIGSTLLLAAWWSVRPPQAPLQYAQRTRTQET